MPDKMDAVALLKADHRTVEDLFAAFEKESGDGRKQKLANQICLELSVHAMIEEEIFYPACEGKVEEDLLKEVSFLLEHHKSFNLYVAHGGTNFGFTAGANSGGKGYEPDLTSYDYDAPIDEQGRATPKYAALRALIAQRRHWHHPALAGVAVGGTRVLQVVAGLQLGGAERLCG